MEEGREEGRKEGKKEGNKEGEMAPTGAKGLNAID